MCHTCNWALEENNVKLSLIAPWRHTKKPSHYWQPEKNITNKLLQFRLPCWLQRLEVLSATPACLQARENNFQHLWQLWQLWHLDDNSRKHTLDSLLASFGLVSTVKFPTRISYQPCTLIDNIFINIYNHDFSVHPLINGLSDHDGQIITFFKYSQFSSQAYIYYYKRN